MTEQKPRKFTRAEVEGHCNSTSLWIIIENNIYDVTKFQEEHPGGDEALLEFAGKDGSDAFIEVGHSSEARELLKQFLVGELVDSEKSYVKYSDKRTSRRGPNLFVPIAISSVVIIGAFIAYRIYRSANN
ncbi:hypothetical protein WA026_016578 [Henosepilachna vigintioctopunctata]|uniref:Cytochrome b5 n=1 Tax=Henosepilachna vigintioctopunctata TaxID=420089 RepID=A0AAW1VGL2_9CUCU